MILGIEASNIRSGGGVTHLVELLKAAEPEKFGISKVVVWSGHRTLDLIPPRKWLTKNYLPILNKSILHRFFWQRFRFHAEYQSCGCDMLFVPGGTYLGKISPFVTMNQNLLPFEWREIRKYGISLRTLKFIVLHAMQKATIQKANGTIYLSLFALTVVRGFLLHRNYRSIVIPHGIDQRFMRGPKKQRSISEYCAENPISILYVSTVDVYKHQPEVVQAVANLEKEGFPVRLTLIGSAYPPSLKKLRATISKVDPGGRFVRYSGELDHRDIQEAYRKADIFVFASACEAFGQILTEAMASGLPVACSSRSSMKEIIGKNAVYFDPENADSLVQALSRLILDRKLRSRISRGASRISARYTWKKCADSTFMFLGATQKNS